MAVDLDMQEYENAETAEGDAAAAAAPIEAQVEQDVPGTAEQVEADENGNQLLDTASELADTAEDVAAAPDAEVTEVAAEAFLKRANKALSRVGAGRIHRPSFESFGTTTSKASNKKLTLESIVEKAKEYWKKFVEWLKARWSSFMDFVRGIFGSAKSVEKMADEVLKLCEKRKGKDHAGKKVKIPNGTARLLVARGSKTVEPGTVISGIDKLAADSTKRLGFVSALESAVKDLTEEKLGKWNEGSEGSMYMGTRRGASEAHPEFAKILNDVKTAYTKAGSDINGISVYPLGGFVLKAEVKTEELTIKIVSDESKMSEVKDIEADVVTPDDGVKLCNTVKSSVKQYIDDKTSKNINTAFKEFVERVEKVAKSGNIATTGDVNKLVRGYQGLINAAMAVYNKDRNIVLKIDKAALAYTKASMLEIEKKAD